MRKYGIENCVFEVMEEAEESFLIEKEQQFIETLKPNYNRKRAKGWDIERHKEHRKEYNKEYEKTDKRKKYNKEYEKTDKRKKYKKEYNKKYRKTDKRKEYDKKYKNQLCCYNGEVLTLCALSTRFQRAGIPHPTQEAKKYLLQ